MGINNRNHPELQAEDRGAHSIKNAERKEPLRALVGAIQKFSTEDGPGIRTTVFLKGCPLNCRWCHNPELIDFAQQIIRLPNSCIHCGYCIEHCPKQAIGVNGQGQIEIDRDSCDGCMTCVRNCTTMALQTVAKEMTVEEVLAKVEQDRGFYDTTGGGMTISGGEMLSQPEFVRELVDKAAAHGIHVCLDTSGFGDGDLLEELAAQEIVTTVLYDMKSIDDAIHQKCTGQSNQLILENLRRLAGHPRINPKLQMRMPLVHNLNDDWSLIERTAEFYRTCGIRKVTLLPYHDLGVSKMRNIGGTQEVFEQPPVEYINQIQTYFQKEAGMTVELQGML